MLRRWRSNWRTGPPTSPASGETDVISRNLLVVVVVIVVVRQAESCSLFPIVSDERARIYPDDDAKPQRRAGSISSLLVVFAMPNRRSIPIPILGDSPFTEAAAAAAAAVTAAVEVNDTANGLVMRILLGQRSTLNPDAVFRTTAQRNAAGNEDGCRFPAFSASNARKI
jgi:hypothetical protein